MPVSMSALLFEVVLGFTPRAIFAVFARALSIRLSLPLLRCRTYENSNPYSIAGSAVIFMICTLSQTVRFFILASCTPQKPIFCSNRSSLKLMLSLDLLFMSSHIPTVYRMLFFSLWIGDPLYTGSWPPVAFV